VVKKKEKGMFKTALTEELINLGSEVKFLEQVVNAQKQEIANLITEKESLKKRLSENETRLRYYETDNNGSKEAEVVKEPVSLRAGNGVSRKRPFNEPSERARESEVS